MQAASEGSGDQSFAKGQMGKSLEYCVCVVGGGVLEQLRTRNNVTGVRFFP